MGGDGGRIRDALGFFLGVLLLLVFAIAFSGCKKDTTEGGVRSSTEGTASSYARLDNCRVVSHDPDGNPTLECTWIDQKTGQTTKTVASLKVYNAAIEMSLVDPMILQMPISVTDFHGTYDDFHGSSGDLVIQSGFTSIPVALNRSLTAETGQQLVIVDLPEGFTASDKWYEFRLAFNPGTTGSVSVKAAASVKVRMTGGSVFYPILLPCIPDGGDLSSLPSFEIPSVGSGNLVELNTDNLSDYLANHACNGESFQLAEGATPIPTFTEVGWALLLMLLSISAVYALRRKAL